MVRHPAEWVHGGYYEIHVAPESRSVIDLVELSHLAGFSSVADFQQAHRKWVAQALAANTLQRDDCWSEALAVGSMAFVEKMRREFGIAARHREIESVESAHILREPTARYDVVFDPENEPRARKNKRNWAESLLGSGA